jgi:hypothetical protein
VNLGTVKLDDDDKSEALSRIEQDPEKQAKRDLGMLYPRFKVSNNSSIKVLNLCPTS